jgi:putative Ca2+/H+ antiporter (TMEM165/GDT1 family)
MRQLLTIFFTVFLAEIGDKTQLATVLFATEKNVGRLGVFVASAGALVASSAIAVLVGSVITRFVPESTLKIAAGVGFMAVGLWTIFGRQLP